MGEGEQGKTGQDEGQAALEAELTAAKEKLANMEAQIQAKQDMINKQSSEVGEVRSLKAKVEELTGLKDTFASLVEKMDGLSEAIKAKKEGANKDEVPVPDGTTPLVQEDPKSVLAETYRKLTAEDRVRVQEYIDKMPEEAQACLDDPQARVLAVTRAMQELGLSGAPKKRGIWDDVAPAPREIPPHERLRMVLDGVDTAKPKPSVSRGAFDSSSGRQVNGRGNESETNVRPGAPPPPIMGDFLAAMDAEYGNDKGG
jgi:hypothetical protein